TFETAKFFSVLSDGRPPLKPMPLNHIAMSVGKSEDYVRGLLRLYREVPDSVRTAWQNDREQRLTFHKLTDLVRLKHLGDEAGVNALLHKIMSTPSRRRGAVPKLPYKTAEQCLAESYEACGLVKGPNGTLIPNLSLGHEKEEKIERRRRMS